jgi:hypothetical protein
MGSEEGRMTADAQERLRLALAELDYWEPEPSEPPAEWEQTDDDGEEVEE